MSYNTDEVNRLIKNRRSIFPKMYTGEEVPRNVVEQMLENANWAPTHKFTEPWRFRVYSGAGIKQLAEYQAALYKSRSLKQDNYQEAKYLKLLNKPLLASHLIALIMRRDPQKRVPEMEEMAAVSCAVQNMYLTATAYGVGCYWSTGGPTFWEESKAFFQLEKEDRLMGFLFVGMPAASIGRGHRGAWQDKVTWIQ